MRRIRLTQSASEDLEELWRYIAIEQESPKAADNVLDKIDEKLKLALLNPGIGESVNHLRPGARRTIVHRRFLVFYEDSNQGLIVLRVLHGSRLINVADFSNLK